MDLQRVKYAVRDFVVEKKYAQGKAPLIAISCVLGVCLIWILSFFFGGESYIQPKPPDSPRHREAAAITASLVTDERFRHLSVVPADDDENTLVVTGEVYTKADKIALKARVATLTSTYTIREESFAMDGQ